MLVMVCVSTWETPSMALSFSKNSASGAKPAASHGPKSWSGTVIMSLKSRQAPHTKRLTVMCDETSLMVPKYSSTRPAMACNDSDVALSPVYLHRHSRHTRSKLMAPLASGTASCKRVVLVVELLVVVVVDRAIVDDDDDDDGPTKAITVEVAAARATNKRSAR
jgi:hypothetical protein